jgi:VIT1/CCC1 family predicted Fe2+/Mn2+ transporter
VDIAKTSQGGVIPMVPYFTAEHINTALMISIGIATAMLFTFGYLKSIVTGVSRYAALYGSLETFLIGAAAAGGSYGIVRFVNKWFEP